MTAYEKPKVWKWEDEELNKGGNRPTAGARFEQTLPVGEAPFQLYSLGTPNGIKVTIMFEELKELGVVDADYDVYLINIGKDDQFGSDFVKINPTQKFRHLLTTARINPLIFSSPVRSSFTSLRNSTSFFRPTFTNGRKH